MRRLAPEHTAYPAEAHTWCWPSMDGGYSALALQCWSLWFLDPHREGVKVMVVGLGFLSDSSIAQGWPEQQLMGLFV